MIRGDHLYHFTIFWRLIKELLYFDSSKALDIEFRLIKSALKNIYYKCLVLTVKKTIQQREMYYKTKQKQKTPPDYNQIPLRGSPLCYVCLIVAKFSLSQTQWHH